jgi:phosphate-selective porin OprO/OprP
VGITGKQATGVSQAGSDGRVQTFRTRDAIRSGLASDWPVPAGINLVGDDLQMANLELAGVQGRWTMQGEYAVSSYHNARLQFSDPIAGNAVYHGGYVQLLRFLTSDHDHYNKTTATFERLKPRENFFLVRGRDGGSISGLGAIQVGARYNYLNLNSQGLNGGILNNLTTGLNWFWNPNMKVQFDYSATQRNVSNTTNFPNGSGWANAWGARIACDF